MNAAEATTVIAYAIGLDSRVQRTADVAPMQVAAWCNLLAEVDPDFARQAIDRHYGRCDAVQISAGDILTAWRTTSRTEASREHTEELVMGGRKAPDWFYDFRRACENTAGWKRVFSLSPGRVWKQEARLARARVRELPDPPSTRPISYTADARERSCGHRLCVCPHHDCRAGWVDGDTLTMRAAGLYPEVTRCPACADAVKMQGETTPASKTTGRRRGKL